MSSQGRRGWLTGGVAVLVLLLATPPLVGGEEPLGVVAERLRAAALAKAREVESTPSPIAPAVPVGEPAPVPGGQGGGRGAGGAANADPATTLGAMPGEELTFNVHWMGVPAATAVMRFESPETGRYSLSATLEAIGMVAAFYPVEDLLVASGRWTALGLRSLYYLKQQKEGRRERRLEYQFRRPERMVIRSRDGGEPGSLEGVGEGINDPLTAFFALRAVPELTPGRVVTFNLVDGQKLYDADVSVKAPESMFTPLGWFRAVAVQPRLLASTLFRHHGKLTIWLTDDARRLPLRVETEVKVGHVAADLVAYKDGRGGEGSIHGPQATLPAESRLGAGVKTP